MGLPMAKNLLKRGFSVKGFDLRAAAMEELARNGGRGADSVGDALADADLAILMVVNAGQAESALFDANAIARLSPGAVVAVMATCPPAKMAALAARVKAAGFGFVDAPVSGGMVGAQAGTLTIMAAGADDDIEKAQPAFAAMGGKIVHIGARPGQGSTAKAVNQLLCGVHLAAAAEALALAERLGVNMPEMLDIVSGSSASSWMLRDRGPRILQDAPPITSAVDIFLKDLGIVVETGDGAAAEIPLARAAFAKFAAASAAGFGALDDSQVVRAYRNAGAETS
ncbi:MAG: NAD(P)-dependent oxidoreductase [Hyphomicrobiales bacterium]|nr:NAD(P)-dependent oxidoreductase [Hyphomicrobiales bacterium]